MTDPRSKDKPARVPKLVGKRFGMLLVTATAGRTALCMCDCAKAICIVVGRSRAAARLAVAVRPRLAPRWT